MPPAYVTSDQKSETQGRNNEFKKPYWALILIQVSFAGMILLSKAAFAGGMSPYVFVFYRQAAGTIILIPLTLYYERKGLPPLTFAFFCKISMFSFIGHTFALNAYGAAIDFTSATLGAAFFNGIPVTTFFFAFLFGLVNVNLEVLLGMAKVAGIVLCLVVGVVILTFYSGLHLKPFFHTNFLQFGNLSAQQLHQRPHSSFQRWILGCFLLFLSSISWGLWLVLQARFLKTYPFPIAFTSFQTLSSAIQTCFIAIAIERDPAQWKLGFDVRLLAVVYCGLFVTFFANWLQSWVMKKNGPVFLAMSTPMNLVVTTAGSLLLLNESISLGSVLGGVVLVVSLYSVLWAKSKEPSVEAAAENDEENHAESKAVDRV